MKINLEPGQTMAQKRAQDRLDWDALRVHREICRKPGIASKADLGDAVGLSDARIDVVIRHINSGGIPSLPMVKHGPIYMKGGPHAGQTVRGWYALNDQRHHVLLDLSDKHSASVEIGVRRSRLVSLALAHGVIGAEAYIASIEERLGETIELLSATDFETFTALVAELLKPEA